MQIQLAPYYRDSSLTYILVLDKEDCWWDTLIRLVDLRFYGLISSQFYYVLLSFKISVKAIFHN